MSTTARDKAWKITDAVDSLLNPFSRTTVEQEHLIIDSAKAYASVLSALTEERIAETIATAEDAHYWVDEIEYWEDGEEWERDAHPDNYPSSAYEDRDYYLGVARAVLALIEQETTK